MGILSNLAKNPTLIALAALGIGLFIFRDRISGFFSDITGGVEGAASVGKTVGILNENFQGFLTGIQDLASGKTFEDVELPKFELPKFEFPTLDFSFLFPKPPLTEAEQFDFSGLEGGVSPEPTGKPAPPFSDAAIFAQDFPEPFVPITPQQDFNVQTTIPDQQFFGGGISFEGGTVTETPIENLSLSQIIDKFMVTASQAANIKAQAIGFTPEEQAFLNQGQEISPLGDVSSMPAVTEGFEGLTPEQIFAQLVGGNIQNF